MSFFSPSNLVINKIPNLIKFIAVVFACSAFSAENRGLKVCHNMAIPLEELGLSKHSAYEYVFDVVSRIRSGNLMDYFEVNTPDNGKRYLTASNLFDRVLYLRDGRTQIVNFEMLKRLPRSQLKIDYLVAITPDDTVDERKVSKVIEKANLMGVRLFPIWAGRDKPSRMIEILAQKTRGKLVDLSGKINPCLKASMNAKIADPVTFDVSDKSQAERDLHELKNLNDLNVKVDIKSKVEEGYAVPGDFQLKLVK